MCEKLNRRKFLRTTGAAVLAVAAVSALTACGGSGSGPSSDAGLTRTLGGLTFNIVTCRYPDFCDGDEILEYKQYYIPIFTVKNNSRTESIKMSEVTFTLTLEGTDDVPDYTTDFESCSSEVQDLSELKELTIGPGQIGKGYIGYIRETDTEEDVRVAYLTIEYSGKKVTYELNGTVFSASGVTNV